MSPEVSGRAGAPAAPGKYVPTKKQFLDKIIRIKSVGVFFKNSKKNCMASRIIFPTGWMITFILR